MTNTNRHWMRLIGAVWLAAAGAAAQDQFTAARRIVVSLTDRRLWLIVDGRVTMTCRVAVGAPDTPSPEGIFQIVNRIESPAWYGSGKVVRPGPRNPLGPRWIGLDRKGYGIHGTNQPRSIGGAKSHGCIRMRNEDVKELFERVAVGDVVELRAEGVKAGAGY